MRKALRITALILALVSIAALCGCHKEETPVKPEKGEKTALTEEQTARAVEIARAFDLFGECDIEKGLELRRVEYMVYCMYTGTLAESGVEGYGMVDKDEADDMLAKLFKGFEPKSMIRTKYDASKDQDYYLSEGRYFVRLTDTSGYEFKVTEAHELVDQKGARLGDVVLVSVIKDGAADKTIKLELIDSDTAVYSIRKCSFEFSE